MKSSELTGPALDWAVAKCEGHEVMLFDQLWRDNAAGKYQSAQVEQHLEWQPEKGKQVIVEVRQLQLDQRSPENTEAVRCSRPIPHYSTDWAQCGQIMERENIGFKYAGHDGNGPLYVAWKSFGFGPHKCESSRYGPTPLIAAMRGYVASKLGDEIEIPEDLK